MADFPKKPKKVGNSGKVWSKGHFLERFDVISLGGVQQDMRGQYGIIKYYEDITDPTIHVEILVTDTNGIMEKLPIRSGSSVNLELSHESAKDPLKYDEKDEPLVVTNIMNHYADAKRETYVLICETKQICPSEALAIFGITFDNSCPDSWDSFPWKYSIETYIDVILRKPIILEH